MRRTLNSWIAATVCSLILALSGFIWYQHYGPGFYSELDAIRAELEKIPQAEILELDGVLDEEPLLLRQMDHIQARIKVADSGELVFSYLSENSIRAAKSLHLVSIGPYQVRCRGEGFTGVYRDVTGEPMRSEFAISSLDLGPEGPFAQLFPFAIPNIQTAVAHYDEILGVVESWAQTPPRHLRDARGTDYYYWATKNRDSAHDSIWTQPFSDLRAK